MSIFQKGLLIAASVAIAILDVSQNTQAGILYNGWNYRIEVIGGGFSGSANNFKRLAVKQIDDGVTTAQDYSAPSQQLVSPPPVFYDLFPGHKLCR